VRGVDCVGLRADIAVTASENDEQESVRLDPTAMSDVDVVSSSSLPPSADAPHPAQVTDGKESDDHHHTLTSPPPVPRPVEVSSEKGDAEADEVLSTKADSEAETIIQSGRESLSPEKRRKHTQHDHADAVEQKQAVDAAADRDASPNTRKRKRMEDDPRDGGQGRRKSSPRPRASSMSLVKRERSDASSALKKRRDSTHSNAPRRQTENGESNNRKRSSSESAIEGDAADKGRTARDLPPSDTAVHRERREKTHPTPGLHRSKDRSVSPSYRSHKRAVSGPQQAIAEHPQKKKKAPAPLLTNRHRHSSEDRQSVSSSASGSPMPSAHLQRLTSSDGAAFSPAKPIAHKKKRDQNGRTRLARACAAQEHDAAVARHEERPEDLNVSDNAGNTPLQIASLEGCAPIVKFLLGAGCEIDTKNIDRDTPLIDAVENGHLEVVKLLLDAGANPRMVNAEGDEPYDLVPSDSEDYKEIRRIIAEAKAHPPRKRRSEDHGVRSSSSKGSVPRAMSVASPRDSPPAHSMRSPPPTATIVNAGRRKTVRSEATRNDLLWTKATPENLRDFAAKGDMAGVANILNVISNADAESLIAAAKGGHEECMQLLLGIGFADPDPDPVQNSNLRPGYNTPMLAAIGRGTLAVIRLLLAQPGFNPTRRLFRDRTYYELARERKGEGWEEEADLLWKAYERYKGSKKMRKPETKSPRRSRDKEKETKRAARRESSSPVAAPNRKSIRSPTSSRHADAPTKEARKMREGSTSVKEKGSTNASRTKTINQDDTHSEHSIAASETDQRKPKVSSSERRPSDASSGNRCEENATKRRRLIAGRPPQDRDRRRLSLMSSDSLSGHDESLKSREHNTKDTQASKASSPSLKRTRSSLSPDRSRSRGADHRHDPEEVHKKKRRVLSEESNQNPASGIKRNDPAIAESLKLTSQKKSQDGPDSEQSKTSKVDNTPGRGISDTIGEPVSVKEELKKQDSESLDHIPMDDSIPAEADPTTKAKTAEKEAIQREEDARKAEELRLVEEQRLAAEAEVARIAKEEEDARKAAEQARLAREKAEEEERKRKEAEQRRIKQAEEERQRRVEQERLRIAKLRREQEEQEQRRRDVLPNRLRVAANLVGSNDPRARSHVWLKQFMPVVTAKTEQIDPSCGPDIADERWVPNFLVAPLLATNDLQLAQYASWEKRKATPTQRLNLWRVTRRILVQADDSDFMGSSFGQVILKDGETRPKYFDMEHVFWVRVSSSDSSTRVHCADALSIAFRLHGPRSAHSSSQWA
jgi:hypothetical protein